MNDECRFQANLSDPFSDRHIRQVWFSSFHSDVEGSCLKSEVGRSRVSFEWILVEAQKARLKIDADRANIVLGRVPIPADLKFLPLYVMRCRLTTSQQYSVSNGI